MKNKHLNFDILINAPKKKVWDTMLQPDTYKEWVNASWPGSYYEGAWKRGTNIKFLAPGHGGTMAAITELSSNESILVEHVAVITSDGKEDRDSAVSKGWIGTTERYTFLEHNGKTTLGIEINTTPEWKEMFNDGWPGALKKLKEICER